MLWVYIHTWSLQKILSHHKLISAGLWSGWKVCLFCHYIVAAPKLSSCPIWSHTDTGRDQPLFLSSRSCFRKSNVTANSSEGSVVLVCFILFCFFPREPITVEWHTQGPLVLYVLGQFSPRRLRTFRSTFRRLKTPPLTWPPTPESHLEVITPK